MVKGKNKSRYLKLTILNIGLILAAMILLLILASSAHSATYHVREFGSDGAVGTSWANAWRTIEKANTETRPGDLVYVYRSGSFIYGFPNPDSAGSNPTGGGRITFIGVELGGRDCLEMSNTYYRPKIMGGTLTKPYVSIKGFWFVSPLIMASTTHLDTISFCTFRGELLDLNNAHYSILDQCFIAVKEVRIASDSTDRSAGLEIWSSVFEMFSSVPTSGYQIWGGRTGLVGSTRTVLACVDSLTLGFNSFDFGQAPTGHPFTFDNLLHTKIRGCTFENFQSGGGKISIRDSSRWVSLDRDTIYAELLFYSNWLNKFSNVTIDSCLIKSAENDALVLQGNVSDFTITRNTILSKNYYGIVPMYGSDGYGRFLDNNFIDHNTVASKYTQFSSAGFSSWNGLTIVSNNIFYSWQDPVQGGACTYNCYDPGCPHSLQPDMNVVYQLADIDSSLAAGGAADPHLRSEGNLYSNYSYTFPKDTLSVGPGGFCIGWWDLSCGTYHQAPTGDLADTTNWMRWSTCQDDTSYYGSPCFQDSTFDGFNGLLKPGSKAKNADLGGTDIGAIESPDYPTLSFMPTGGRFMDDTGLGPQVVIIAVSNISLVTDTLLTTYTITSNLNSDVAMSAVADTVANGESSNLTLTFTPPGTYTANVAGWVTITSNDLYRSPSTIWVEVEAVSAYQGNPRWRIPD